MNLSWFPIKGWIDKLNFTYLTLSYFFIFCFLLPVWGSFFLMSPITLYGWDESEYGWSHVVGVQNSKIFLLLFYFYLIGRIVSLRFHLLGYIAYHSFFMWLFCLGREGVFFGITLILFSLHVPNFVCNCVSPPRFT